MTTRWPNLFVAGAAKAGTTALWGALDGHPEIGMSALKEPHYFSSWQPIGQRRIETDEQYLRLFEEGAALRYRGEASVGYFTQEQSTEQIRARCPDARIVLSLREPVARAHSAFLFRQRRHGQRQTFSEAIEAELAEGGWRDLVEPGRYATHVSRWLDAFGPKRVHVLFFEELVREPEQQLGELLEFLELDAAEPATISLTRRNEYLVPGNRLAALALAQPVRKLARRILPTSMRERGERLLASEGRKPEIEDEARALLEPIFAPERERLEDILGRKAPW